VTTTPPATVARASAHQRGGRAEHDAPVRDPNLLSRLGVSHAREPVDPAGSQRPLPDLDPLRDRQLHRYAHTPGTRRSERSPRSGWEGGTLAPPGGPACRTAPPPPSSGSPRPPRT